LYRKQIYVKEITPKINWKIEKDTKKIGNFVCKKAIANFRGRDYIAWFAIEISVPYGPWKLNGLPGLILEAYDKNKNVYWYFKSVEYPSNTKEKIKYMTIPLKEKFKTYDELKKFQVEQQKKSEENSILLKKQYPQISVAIPKLDEMFIEFE
jgi:GLPGLI family protein